LDNPTKADKQVKPILRSEGDLLTQIMDTSPVGIMVFDRQGRIIFANNLITQIAEQVGAMSLIGRSYNYQLWKIYSEDGKPIRDEQYPFKRVMKSGQSVHDVRLSFELPDGSKRYISSNAAPVFDEAGQISSVVTTTSDITLQTKAEDALRYQATLLKNISDAVITTDLDFKIQTWNSIAESLYGWRAEEVIDKSVETVLPTEYPDDSNEEVLAQFQEEGIWHGEAIQRSKDGTPIYVLASVSMVRDERGRPVSVLAINRDITLRKRAEETLRTSQEFMQSTLDSLSSHIAILDGTGTILAVNASWRRFADQNGLVRVDYGLGSNYFQVTEAASSEGSESASRAAEGMREVIKGQRDEFLMEYPCHSPLEERWFVMRVTRFYSTEGVRLVTSHEDITQRKRMDQLLRTSEEKYRELVEKIDDVIYAIDLQGVLTYVSPAVHSFLGLPPEQIIGLPFTKFVLPEDLERAQDNFQELVRSGSPGSEEYRVLTDSGELRWMRVSSQPIRVEGRVVGVQGVLSDITENKHMQEQLERAAAVAERQRLARDLHDSVTQSLYSLDLFASAADEAISKRKIETAEAHIHQIQNLSQSALANMRLLLFELRPPVLEDVGLAGALQERLELVETRAGLKTHFEVKRERALKRQLEVELYAVALEALNNSLKHSQAEQVTVLLEFHPGGCCLSITDNGVGFDLDAAKTAGGYGLRNMQERVVGIGGDLTLETSLGSGTSVHVQVDT